MADIFTGFHVVCPHMPGYYLGVVCALCTLLQVWTNSAFLRIALVFAVAVPVGGAVLQYLVARTDVAIIKLIIYILILLKESESYRSKHQ